MRALVAILLCCLLAGAMAWERKEDPVAKCIRRKKCGGTYKPICAFNAGTGQYGGFPSKCFMKCANAGSTGLGNHWVADHYCEWPSSICYTCDYQIDKGACNGKAAATGQTLPPRSTAAS
jgi:hypothetical protein